MSKNATIQIPELCEVTFQQLRHADSPPVDFKRKPMSCRVSSAGIFKKLWVWVTSAEMRRPYCPPVSGGFLVESGSIIAPPFSGGLR